MSQIAEQPVEDPVVNPYDALTYPSNSFAITHIGRLAAIGRLFGVNTVYPAKARVLELGCGTGINLLSMAQLFPEARFIGVDLSQSQIEIAQQAAKAAGLENVQFLHVDLCELEEGLGSFDYIIAHGVYSWIPDATKEALLKANKKHLAANGIAYVSYNCLPGWKMRGALRDMMLMHTGGIEDGAEKVNQAKALLKFLSSASNQESPYGKFLSQELELLLNCDDAYIAHEFLEADNDAFYFMDFHRQAAEADLFYLGDAQAATMMMADIPKEAQATFTQLKGSLAATEQYLDFLRNRTFRCSMLCHPGQPIERDIKPEKIADFLVVSEMRMKKVTEENPSFVFMAKDGSEVTVNDAVTARVFEAVVMNGKIPVEVLIDSLIEPIGAMVANATEEGVREAIAKVLLRGYFSTLIDFYMSDHALPVAPEAKPQSLPLARWQAAQNLRVSNDRLGMIKTEGFIKEILIHCDGTRTREELVALIANAAEGGQLSFKEKEQTITDSKKIKKLSEELLEKSLQQLRHQGILYPGS